MKIQKSYSNSKPPEWDTASSTVVVYRNTEITELPETDYLPKMYGFTQTVYTREEYMEMLAQENAQRISFAEEAILALMDSGMGVQ